MTFNMTINSGFPEAAKSFNEFAKLSQKWAILPQTAGILEDNMLKLLRRTTGTWKGPVEFGVAIKFDKSKVIIIAETSSDVWIWVNFGTRPHVIRAKNAPRLRFQVGYTSKSQVADFTSGAGGSFGPTAFAVQVNHPGTEARRFDLAIAKALDKSVPEIVKKHYTKRVDKRFKREVFK